MLRFRILIVHSQFTHLLPELLICAAGTRIKAGNFSTRDLRAAVFRLLYNPR